MGTEMTPIASQEPSRTATPIRATTPTTRSPIHSGTSTPMRNQNGLLQMEAASGNDGSTTRQCGEGLSPCKMIEKNKIEDQGLYNMGVKAERMKAVAQEKLTNKLAATRRIAEEKRANAQEKLNDNALKTTERVEYIRRTGHVPSSFSCTFKFPSICW
ncbi:hypothetical protein TSUD_67960 [Trifolium subterraneum]|uniref:Remorin C-terminal domain-containing protein n=1 Tax=Trifolium subterraneum TaxID=3900 RepID=A0A2Z6MC57_TRISU|nr:hypothetical protein TSUD_67960 [Trifolium subterraneum]